jgi:hypothetical protein
MVHTPADPKSSAAVPVSLLARWQRVSYERSFDRVRAIIVMIALPVNVSRMNWDFSVQFYQELAMLQFVFNPPLRVPAIPRAQEYG